VTRPVHVITALQVRPEATQRFLDLMRHDYDFIAADPALVSATLLASRTEPNTWFHATHWASAEALAKTVEHPTVREIFASLPLISPPTSHQCDARIVAAQGNVHTPDA